MRYTVNANDLDSDYIELEFDPPGGVRIVTASGETTFSIDEFRELRKAVGYVWQEVEQNG